MTTNDDISTMTDLSDIPDMISTEIMSIKTPSMASSTEGRNRIGRAILTYFPPNTDDKWLAPETIFGDSTRNTVMNWVAQFEECPETERLHVHAYVEFHNRARPKFHTLRQRLGAVIGKPGNVRPSKRASKNQQECAVNYCTKPDGRLEGTEPLFWPQNKTNLSFQPKLIGNKKDKKSRQDEKEEQVKYILSRPEHWTWDQILHETGESQVLLAACSWGAKFHNGRHARHQRRTIQNVIVFYGAGGTGKTTMAHKWDTQNDEDYQCRIYSRCYDDGKFWGGGRTAYKGQRIVHLEEFCGQETAANFKQICDIGKYGPSVNIKNGGTDLNHQTIIITSNHHPAAWYRKLFADDPKQWNPICRRLTQVWFFPEKRPDGTDNIPDENHLPYYMDQTETFLGEEFQRDYNEALLHAQEWWPLAAREEFNADTQRGMRFE